ncbi:MAG: hypothetical protein NZ853_03560 [Leptospiraceae bacterium]|nr:hypothetical protein [Leptospiraceae bacterium]MDW7975251.1 hypothetical protein [Leptospiraceae bacterium]
MEFLSFYKFWFLYLYKGWRNLVLFLFEYFKGFTYEFWVLLFVSILLLLMVVFPWFSYQIQFDELETIYLRTKKWYWFSLPVLTTFLFMVIHHKLTYSIQLIINLFVIFLFVYGYWNTSIHINIKGEYEVLYTYYLYFVVLVFHTFLISFLKKGKNTFFEQIHELWKKYKRKIQMNHK